MEQGKLRIAIFSDSAFPILNGVSVSIQSLVSELRNLGHSVTIFTASHFNYRDPDPECNLNLVLNAPRKQRVRTALSNSFGFGGSNSCVILRHPDEVDAIERRK